MAWSPSSPLASFRWMRKTIVQTTELNARRMIENLKTRNVDKVMEQYAEDATFQIPSFDSPLKGKAAIRAFYAGTFTAFPDWTMDVTKVIVSGGESIVVNSVHGTHRGAFIAKDGHSVAPTNRRFSQEQLTRVIFNSSDKVQSLRSYGTPADVPC